MWLSVYRNASAFLVWEKILQGGYDKKHGGQGACWLVTMSSQTKWTKDKIYIYFWYQKYFFLALHEVVLVWMRYATDTYSAQE